MNKKIIYNIILLLVSYVDTLSYVLSVVCLVH